MVAVSLEEARRLGVTNFSVFTDSISVYLQLSGLSHTPKTVENLVTHCRSILYEEQGRILWTQREFITASDSLAKLARTNAISNYWSSEFPPWLKELNCNDMFSMSCN